MSGRGPAGRPLRLLVVGMNYAPEPVGIAVYTAGLAEGLAARGHAVEAVAATPWYPAWAPMAGWPRGWSSRREGGVRVVRCPHPIPRRPTAPARLTQQALWAASAAGPALARARAFRPDAVLSVAPALLSAPVALAAARLAEAPAWLHVQDFEAEAAAGLLGAGGLAARAALAVERRLMRAFDRVTTLSPAMRAKLIEKGVPEARAGELRNWADLAAVRPLEGPSPYRAEWGLEGRRVALYSGNLGAKQGLEMLVAAAARLAAEPDLSDLTLVICGEGSERARLEAAAAALGPAGPQVQFRPLQPADRLGALLGLADIHLLPQRGAAADLMLPSKLANMLASGRPVLAAAAPGTQLAAEVAGCGLAVAPDRADAFAAGLAALARAPRARDALGRAARARAEARWGCEAALDAAEAELFALAGRGAAPSRPSAEHPAEIAADAALADAAVRAALTEEAADAAPQPPRAPRPARLVAAGRA